LLDVAIFQRMDTQKHRTDSRSAFLHAARDLIFTRSFAHVGAAEICARAGVRKGSRLFRDAPGWPE